MQIDFSGVDGRIVDAFLARRADKCQAEARSAIRRQRQANAELLRENRSLTGLGGATMNVDPVIHHFWEQREGKGVWEDKTHKRLMRAAGIVMQPPKGTRVQVSVPVRVDSPETRNGFQQVAVNKWVKVY